MSRVIINIILILIMLFSLSAFPLNTEVMEMDLFSAFQSEEPPEEVIEPKEIKIEAKLNDKSDHYQLLIVSNHSPEEYPSNLAGDVKINLYESGKLVETFGTDLIEDTPRELLAADQYSHEIKLNITEESLNLGTGSYYVDIEIDNPEFREFSFDHIDFVIYSSQKYVGSTDEEPSGQRIVTVYYLDEDYYTLVPYSEAIDTYKTIYRMAINKLFDGPGEGLGLSVTSPAPRVPSMKFIGDGIMSLRLNSNEIEAFDVGSAAASFAIDSMTKTLTNIEDVHGIKIYVDGSDQGVHFHGTDLTENFYDNSTTQAYLGMETSADYIYLVPMDLNLEESNEKVFEIFNALKKVKNITYSDQMIATIPQNVELLNYKVSGGMVTLNFSKEFLNAFDGSRNLTLMMRDSILYSFSTLEEVNRVEFQVDGQPIEVVNEIYFSGEMRPNKYINISPQ